MASSLIWTESALRDVEGICAYIAQDSPHFAAATVDDILLAIEAVREFPQAGRVVPEYGNPDMREVLTGNYRIVYQIAEGQIVVIAVVHGSRQLDAGSTHPQA